MTVAISELHLSRRVTHLQYAELLYLVTGTDDDATALAKVVATAPATYDFADGSLTVSIPQTSVEVEPIMADTVTGKGIWEGRVQYAAKANTSQSPPADGESEFQFDTTGGTSHITVSRSTVGAYPSANPNFKHAIGFDGQNVQGCDIVTPVYRFSEKHFKSNSFVDAAYKTLLRTLTGTVNNATFKTFASGEVLFLGCSGARRGSGASDLWELTYSFAVSPNRASFYVGDIEVTTKNGWDYMWVRFKDSTDGTANEKIRIPAHVRIERVYEYTDLSQLDIGG